MLLNESCFDKNVLFWIVFSVIYNGFGGMLHAEWIILLSVVLLNNCCFVL